MRWLFNSLIFISFIFLFLYLWKQDIIIPELPNARWLLPAVAALYLGFWVSAISWKISLGVHGIRISRRDALVSQGQTIFAKYIPGKVFVILGRAGYVSKNKKELKNTTFVSFKEQMIYTWSGLLISAVPTLVYFGLSWQSVVMAGLEICLTLFLFIPFFHKLFLKILKKLIRREFELPVLNFWKSLPIIISTSLIWICWTLSFYFFIMVFTADSTPLLAFAFPLSVCLGMVAIVLPGGLGLREGILVGALVVAGLDVETATTISFMNRLMFISGEVFIFLVALVTRVTIKARHLPQHVGG